MSNTFHTLLVPGSNFTGNKHVPVSANGHELFLSNYTSCKTNIEKTRYELLCKRWNIQGY